MTGLLTFAFWFQADIDAAVATLLKLKEEYKTLTGTDVPSTGAAPARKEKEKKPAATKPTQEQAAATAAAAASADQKKQTK